MNVYSTVSKLIFAGLATFALSTVTLAASHEEEGSMMGQDEMQSMEDDAPTSTSDQDGMAGKDSANQEKMKKGMENDSMSSDEDPMEDNAPTSGSDQEGMEKKDSTNSEMMKEEDM